MNICDTITRICETEQINVMQQQDIIMITYFGRLLLVFELLRYFPISDPMVDSLQIIFHQCDVIKTIQGVKETIKNNLRKTVSVN